MHNCFHAGDILLPRKISMKKWACVACDQFSSQVEYWEQVAQLVGDAPSTFHMIMPEAFLKQGKAQGRLPYIHDHMNTYLEGGLFETHRRSFIYLERTMQNGAKRRGLVGQVDLEEYDFHPGSGSKIRATEGTVQDRLPPRMELLRGAKLEFPHVIMLCDDRRDAIMTAARSVLGQKVYDFDLMQDGGHITGWLISGLGVSVVNAAVTEYIDAVSAQQQENPMAFAVGDGNHSLASAKACWEEIKPTLTPAEREEHPARFALVELENIHDPAIAFEPIHRVVTEVDTERLAAVLEVHGVESGYPLTLVTQNGEQTIYLDPNESPLAIAILQPILDDFLQTHGGCVDYIHGEDVVRSLAQKPNTMGMILPGMAKESLFPGVLQNGVLPRKTFSMGEAREKRYYLEGKMRV